MIVGFDVFRFSQVVADAHPELLERLKRSFEQDDPTEVGPMWEAFVHVAAADDVILPDEVPEPVMDPLVALLAAVQRGRRSFLDLMEVAERYRGAVGPAVGRAIRQFEEDETGPFVEIAHALVQGRTTEAVDGAWRLASEGVNGMPSEPPEDLRAPAESTAVAAHGFFVGLGNVLNAINATVFFAAARGALRAIAPESDAGSAIELTDPGADLVVDLVVDLLSLVGSDLPADPLPRLTGEWAQSARDLEAWEDRWRHRVRGWTPEERVEVASWAGAVHHASDNEDVVVPPRPAVLAAWADDPDEDDDSFDEDPDDDFLDEECPDCGRSSGHAWGCPRWEDR